MKTLLLIGMGSGNPQQITVQAIEALNRTSVFFVLDKGQTTYDLVPVSYTHLTLPTTPYV